MLLRKEMEKREEETLAAYAVKSSSSRGRAHNEPEHDYRTIFQRDRDRIIHSTAFRRLEYKTQVFVIHEGDHYRTRLTHTLEVCQIARSIARALKLNEDLAETLALAHDIGHPPFGHAGEEALMDIMKDFGGFNHNIQGLRIVDMLEERYPDFKGLNLTWEVREGINKHSTPFDGGQRSPELSPDEPPTLESQVVDVADEIAYDNHDLDDGLASGLIGEADLDGLEIWSDIKKNVLKRNTGIDKKLIRRLIIRMLIDKAVTDVIHNSEKNIKDNRISSLSGVRGCAARLIGFSREAASEKEPLKKFLSDNLYKHYRVARMSTKARRFVRDIFDAYLEDPAQLPPDTKKRLGEEEKHRVICDYIAGMTDRYALDEYKKLFQPYERV
ncbi:MAG: deoxyguanosinetriphosphate triphosphohydrolase [Candidatus Omnitrophica bacterium CG1_02_49_10]|nr:MAG: deoxyguanosinetriphosphate triphosphohydrolase [Candidatus Omnitrophica bacterium CG1_02_49_10]